VIFGNTVEKICDWTTGSEQLLLDSNEAQSNRTRHHGHIRAFSS
jgi:hypothetical protein